ncbi:MAG: hypothetical protein GY715_14280 [Planctomycetes bacterium]|nr:hypothetical protein [Planctomycetota bacterium]
MITLPAGWAAELITDHRPVTGYEITLQSGTVLRYGSHGFTFDSNTYKRQVLEMTELEESLSLEVPEFTLTLSNVDETLTPYLEPLDLLEGSRVVIRVMLRDSGGTFLSGSVERFFGLIESVDDGDEESIDLHIVGPSWNYDNPLPGVRTGVYCWKDFADGRLCNYVGGLTTCDRRLLSTDGCSGRSREHEFGGFPGVDTLERLRYLLEGRNRPILFDSPTSAEGRRIAIRITPDPDVPEVEPLGSIKNAAPLIYGRRRVIGRSIERTVQQYVTPGGTLLEVDFKLLSFGEIDNIVAWYGDGLIGVDRIGSSGYKELGIYWRSGTIGLDDDETAAEYLADPNTLQRAQNRDALSHVPLAYSNMAYAIFIQEADTDSDRISDISFDVRGIKVQKYTAAGATDGARVWSENPVWQLVDLLLSHDYGFGRFIAASDLDWSVIKPTADYVDVEIDSFEATVIASGSSTDRYAVDDASGFYRGMKVLYDGGPYSDEVDEVLEIINGRLIRLGTSRNPAAGHTVTGRTPRFTSNLTIDREASADEVLESLLVPCFGYMPLGDGKIQIVSEQARVVDATFKDTGAAAGYGILEGSFRWENVRGEHDHRQNRVDTTYRDHDGADAGVQESDWNSIRTGRIREDSIDLPAVLTHEHANRITQLRYSKHRELGRPAKFTVGPIGLAVQVGDHIEVTHAAPGWVDADKRVIATEYLGLGDDDEGCVALTVVDYDSSVYVVPTVTPIPLFDYGDLSLVLVVNMNAAGRIVLTWSGDAQGVPRLVWNIYKRASSFGSGPPAPDERIGRVLQRRKWVYQPTADEIGTTLYFIVSGGMPRPDGFSYSNEVSILATLDDPTDEEPESQNRVYGGSFDSERHWQQTEAGGSTVIVEADATVGGGDWTNPDNAHNADDLSYAELDVDDGNSGTVEFTFAAGTKTGQPYGKVWATNNNGSVRLEFTKDGGSSWIELDLVTTRQGLTEKLGPQIVNQDMSLFRMRATGYSGRNPRDRLDPWLPGHHRAYVIGFADQAGATAPFSIIANGIATLVSDGVTPAELSRPFPGQIGDPTILAYNTESVSTWGLYIRRRQGETSAVDANVTIYVRETQTGTEYLAADFDKDDVSDDFQAFAQRFTPGVSIAGDAEVIVRYLGTVGVDVDNLEETLGDGVPRQFGTTATEEDQGNFGDAAAGVRSGYTRGGWDSVSSRISALTGNTK